MSAEMSEFARTILEQKYLWKEKGEKTWDDVSYRVTKNVMRSVGYKMNDPLSKEIFSAISNKKFFPGGRYLYATGRPYHQTQNCLMLRAEDSREGWSDLLYKSSMALMTGAGLGVDYSNIRSEGKPIRKTGGVATGPIELMKMLNECARGIQQGGSRRSALFASLNWKHPDIHKFIRIKNWSSEVKELKTKNFNFPATLDGTNISIGLDDEFFEAYFDEKHPQNSLAHSVYWATIDQMVRTAEPGFSINLGNSKNETLRNACCELVSEDDSDICNLGSINIAKVESLEEMKRLTEICTAFLLAGTVYSDVPYPKVDQIRSKNRRLGLGIMGIHEWLLKNGKKYGPDEELKKYLEVYATSGDYAKKYAKEWELSIPVKTRSIAPTGSIGILAETTTGIEPIFCAAYKRRYLKHNIWNYQYVVDPTVKRLVEQHGINPDNVEDAYVLSENVERRIEFQAWVQQYVDHAISSTINLPKWGSEFNNENTKQSFGNILLKYLPQLRGITCYPDGSREGQVLIPVEYSNAIKNTGEVHIEQADICDISKGGSCND